MAGANGGGLCLLDRSYIIKEHRPSIYIHCPVYRLFIHLYNVPSIRERSVPHLRSIIFGGAGCRLLTGSVAGPSGDKEKGEEEAHHEQTQEEEKLFVGRKRGARLPGDTQHIVVRGGALPPDIFGFGAPLTRRISTAPRWRASCHTPLLPALQSIKARLGGPANAILVGARITEMRVSLAVLLQGTVCVFAAKVEAPPITATGHGAASPSRITN